MAELTDKERISIWRQRIKVSKEVRDKEVKIWDKNLAAFRGRLKPDENVWSPEDPWVSVELVHASIRASIPSLLYYNPAWTVYPRKPEIEVAIDPETQEEVKQDISWERARAKELWLDHTWRESCGNQHVRVAITDAFLRLGCVKVGYAPIFEDCEYRGEFEYDYDSGELIPDGFDGAGTQLYKLRQGQFLYQVDPETGEETDEVVVDEDTGLPVLHPGRLQREAFFCEWVNPQNLLFDPEGGNIFENHRYVVEEWIRPLDHVRNDTRFSPTVRRRIEGVTSVRKELQEEVTSDDPVLDDTPVNNDEARVRGWDIWDFENKRLLVIVEECPDIDGSNDEFLLDMAIPPGIEHGPFVFLKFNEDPGRWYGRTDAEAMAKLELEYNLLRSQMLVHRNQAKTRWLEIGNQGFEGIEGGDVERQKFESGKSGVIVKIKSPDGIQPARKDQVDASIFSAIPNIRLDFSEMAGQPGESRGVADADTATQASLLAANADVRNNDRRDNLVQAFLSNIARKLLQSAAANASQVAWTKIARDPKDPNPFDFKPINPEDLEGEFEVGVVMGSTQPKNSAARVQLYERILLLIGQNPILAAAPTLMRRMFEAIDLKDDALIEELLEIGKAALGQMQGQDQQPGATDPSQVLGQIANQFMGGGEAPNAAAGIPTGARSN